MMKYVLVALLSAFVVVACTPTTNPNDEKNAEVGTPDAATQDQAAQDQATQETVQEPTTQEQGTPDPGSPDVVATDTAPQEQTTQEAPQEASPQENVVPDAAPQDTPAQDTGTTDTVKDTSMSFFITSKGPGDGANLGGLTGADAHCLKLAEAAGVKGKTWRAYLSATNEDARDRIGTGPWYNAKGVMVAKDVADLHSANNNVTKQSALSENGDVVNGRGDTPNRHDIMTGSTADGKLNAGKTCADWTSNSTGSATVGHHDRQGGGADPMSWNSAHDSRSCSQADLIATGGDGLFYCFAK